MATMSEDDYLKSRVDDQIGWYDRKSQVCKRGFVVCQIITLAASATIPVVAVFSGSLSSRAIVAILGSLTAVAIGVLSIYQFRENWIEYRTTAESLKHEKYLFLTKTGPYTSEDLFSVFVDRIESLVSQENTAWRQLLTTPKKDGKSNG